MPSDIRLRLTIRRHGIPEVKLVWPCAASEDFTIAKLLSQVNDIVTLESGQWGLEDYAVELADSSGDNFECLHYQRVGAVFKNDDQVLIRSLLTDDIKRRRLSGRHQISSDGKHLVDGLAFGRPWLRTPGDRPQVTLPPRKRARITYEDDDLDDEEEEDEEPPRKLLLEEAQPLRIGRNGRLLLDSTEPLIRHLDNGTDDENDQDYVPGGDTPKRGLLTGDNEDEDDGEEDMPDEGEDLDEEIRLLQADNEIIGEPSSSQDVLDPSPQPPRNLIQEFIRAIEAPSDPVTMAALQAAFPLIPKSTIELQLKENEMDVRRTYRSLEASYTASLSYDELLDGCVTGRFEILAKIAEKEEAEAKVPARPLIQEVETINHPPASVTKTHGKKRMVEVVSSESSDDTSSSDASSSDSDTESSDSDSDEEHPPTHRTGTATKRPVSSDDESSSDESSDSDSDFGGGPLGPTDAVFAAAKAVADSSSESSSSSSDSSSDDSDSSEDESSDDNSGTSKPEEVSSKLATANSRPRIEVVESTPLTELKQQIDAPSSVISTEAGTVGRGLGLSKTQKRNARRKKLRDMKKLEGPADPAQDITADSLNKELLARKQALLIAVTEETTMPDDAEMTGTGDKDEHCPEQATTKETKLPNEQQNGSPAVNPEDEKSTDAKDSSATSQRRMRVDMGAGRRLLFGALGVKAPKSKADEETLKKDLMKDVRPLKNHRQLENGDAPPSGQGSNPADKVDDSPLDDSWKEKITYRGVECCYEGVALSEPPFPFVQRWDPQQQYGSMRKRKRESHNFTQDESYDNEEDEVYEYPEPSGARFGSAHKKARTNKRQEKRASKTADTNTVDDIELNYDDPPIRARESSHPTEIEDLPPIPDDLTNLALLQQDMVKPGMVITWKQLSMSKMTNWQPQLASVTGVVLSVDERQRLNVMLAKRDREQAEKLYDEETGERIYDKFEMPDDSAEEEDAEDDGHRELAWNELIEPRIVQEAPSSPLVSNAVAKEASAAEQTANAKPETGSDSIPGNSEAMELDQPQVEELRVEQDQHMADSSLPESGQGMAHLEFSIPSLDPPTTNSDGSRPGASQSQHGDDQTKAGMLQQGKRPLIEVVPTDDKSSARLDEDSDDSDSDSDSSFQDAAPSLDVIAASTNSDAGDSAKRSDSSSSGSSPSIHSGRQPGTELEVPDSMNHAEEEDEGEPVIPDSNQEENEATPKAKPGTSGDDSGSQSSSALPSVQEIWETAQTSKKTRSVLKAPQESTIVKEKAKGGVENQEAKQKLDNVVGDGATPQLRQSTTRKLFPNATQPPTSKSLEDSPDLEDAKPSSRSRRRQGKDVLRSSPGLVQSASEEDGDGDVEDEVKEKLARLNKGPGRPRKGKDGTKADQRRKSLPMATSLRSGKKYSPQTGGRSVSVAGRRASKKT